MLCVFYKFISFNKYLQGAPSIKATILYSNTITPIAISAVINIISEIVLKITETSSGMKVTEMKTD